MKKNDWILLITVALYSFLFYQQTAGINFLIFTVAVVIGLYVKDNNLIKNNKWKLAAVGSLLSALCISCYGNSLSVIANIISLSLLSALSYSSNTSVILSLLFSFYSYFSSAVFILLDWQERKLKQFSTSTNPLYKRILLVVIPLFITLLFFFMYQASNSLFNDFTKNINLDFISIDWIIFTIGGFLLLYGFFYHNQIKYLADLDANASNTINPNNNKTITLFGKQISASDEEFSGLILFILLNVLLLIVNALDINFLFIGQTLPAGVTYSQFVHQGTGMLIISIIIAIAIILFYFRGALNFSEKSKTIKILAYLWIIQNAFMLISTGLRNNIYIAEYSLTYKRIGVYIYLLLAFIGLITTYIKIVKIKSNNYLFRTNTWLFYYLLIIACFINWDNVVTEFNIHKAKILDKDYLVEGLSDSNLPQLVAIQDTAIKNTAYYESSFENSLSKKLYYFLNKQQDKSWRSWSYDNSRVHNKLIDLNNSKRISKLILPSMGLYSLEPIKELNNVTEMNLSSNKLYNIEQLSDFISVKSLNLSSNLLSNLKGIEKLKDLEYLFISQNSILDYSPLYNLKKLKEVHVSYKINELQLEELQRNLPNVKIIKTT
jgi:hypothetical protein